MKNDLKRKKQKGIEKSKKINQLSGNSNGFRYLMYLDLDI